MLRFVSRLGIAVALFSQSWCHGQTFTVTSTNTATSARIAGGVSSSPAMTASSDSFDVTAPDDTGGPITISTAVGGAGAIGDLGTAGIAATASGIVGPANVSVSTLANGGVTGFGSISGSIPPQGARITIGRASSNFTVDDFVPPGPGELAVAYGTVVISSLAVEPNGILGSAGNVQNDVRINGPGFGFQIPAPAPFFGNVTDVLGGTTTTFPVPNPPNSDNIGAGAFWSVVIANGNVGTIDAESEDSGTVMGDGAMAIPYQSRGFANATVAGVVIVPAAALPVMQQVVGVPGVVANSPVEALIGEPLEIPGNPDDLFETSSPQLTANVGGAEIDSQVGNSVVDSLELTFDALLVAGDNPFTLTRTNGAGPEEIALDFNLAYQDGQTVFTLTPSAGQSFGDGVYSITVNGDDLGNFAGTQIDPDVDGVAGGSLTLAPELAVLFGDGDGDRSVGLSDFGAFRAAFGTSLGDPSFNDSFDADRDGTIGLSDFAAFRANFGLSI